MFGFALVLMFWFWFVCTLAFRLLCLCGCVLVCAVFWVIADLDLSVQFGCCVVWFGFTVVLGFVFD